LDCSASFCGLGLGDGEPDPDANAAVGTAIAAALMSPAMARRRFRDNMWCSSPRIRCLKSTDEAQGRPTNDLRKT
jgi:hypothetical protein